MLPNRGQLSSSCSGRTHQLVGVFGPGQVAHLGPSVDALQGLPRERVPEADAAVGCAPTRGQKPMLVWGPGNGFDCCQVLCVLLHGTQAGVIPDKELAERKDMIKLVPQSCVHYTHKPQWD